MSLKTINSRVQYKNIYMKRIRSQDHTSISLQIVRFLRNLKILHRRRWENLSIIIKTHLLSKEKIMIFSKINNKGI